MVGVPVEKGDFFVSRDICPYGSVWPRYHINLPVMVSINTYAMLRMITTSTVSVQNLPDLHSCSGAPLMQARVCAAGRV